MPSHLLETNGSNNRRRYRCEFRSDVGDGHLDHAIVENPGRQGHFPLILTCHRFKRVANEVDENLLDLNPIHEYFRGLFVKLEIEARRERSNTAQCKSNGFLDHRRKRFRSPFCLIQRDELTESVDDVACAQGLGNRFVRDVLRYHQAGMILPSQQPLCRVDRVDDCRERLGKFVCERGGHLARCREARHMKQFVAQFLKAIGLLAL